jgi:aspartate-semialdehyde dehydrogenase
MKKLPVAILGAPGAVGQRFIQLLENHPWFEVAEVVGKTSAGKRYGDASHWILDGSVPERIANMVVKPLDAPLDSPLVFSALPKEAALECELAFAAAGHVVATNASAYRMTDDVPLLLPEINCNHISLIDQQRKNRGWTTGALVANSNCTVMPVVMSLAPLMQFGVSKVHMVSEQALSGAGYPGVASLDAIDNIVPYVPSDEEKMELESRKMLGTYRDGKIEHYDFVASATCTRVPVIDGHTVIMSVEMRAKPSLDEVIAAWRSFVAPEEVQGLPSAPSPMLHYLPQIDRPQPRRDRNAGNGMATSIGRLRECPILGYKFVTLSHNTIRGAAGCSILNAELLATRGYISGFSVS